jgi:hypothetical protein
MAKKKPTPREREIAQLAKSYQSSISQLQPEFQNVFAQKQEKLAAYNARIGEYQGKLEAFNKELAAYKKNPPQKLVSNTFEYNPYSNQVFVRIPNVGWRETYPRNQLPSGYYVKGDGDYTNVYTNVPAPKFTEKEPAAVDLSEPETKMAEIESKRKNLAQTFERETAERRSSTIQAVGQRARSRPMLAKGVNLNG